MHLLILILNSKSISQRQSFFPDLVHCHLHKLLHYYYYYYTIFIITLYLLLLHKLLHYYTIDHCHYTTVAFQFFLKNFGNKRNSSTGQCLEYKSKN